MKKAVSLVLVLMLGAWIAPAYADGSATTAGTTGEDQVKNVKTGAQNVGTGWVEVMDNAHAEASKGKNTGENLTGTLAGSAIGVRKGIHRIGAGAIDLLTFWIPKKQPLINPEKARLQ